MRRTFKFLDISLQAFSSAGSSLARPQRAETDLLAAFDTAAEKAGVSHEAVFEKRATIDFPDLLVDNARPRDLTIVPAEERAKILCHHGIESYWDKVDANGRPTGEVPDSYGLCYTIDLLVMGAYGHSRLRELILAARPKACFQSLLFRPCSPLIAQFVELPTGNGGPGI